MLDEHEPDAEAERRRRMDAARGVFFTPSYQGHWPGAVLFAATMVGATLLWSGLPMALSLLGGAGNHAGNKATFLTLYAAMAVGPIAGWILWARRRRWAAMAVTAVMAACAAWLSPVIGL